MTTPQSLNGVADDQLSTLHNQQNALIQGKINAVGADLAAGRLSFAEGNALMEKLFAEMQDLGKQVMDEQTRRRKHTINKVAFVSLSVLLIIATILSFIALR